MEGQVLLLVAVVGIFSTLEVISVVITLLLRISTVVVVDIAGVPVLASVGKERRWKQTKTKKNRVTFGVCLSTSQCCDDTERQIVLVMTNGNELNLTLFFVFCVVTKYSSPMY